MTIAALSGKQDCSGNDRKIAKNLSDTVRVLCRVQRVSPLIAADAHGGGLTSAAKLGSAAAGSGRCHTNSRTYVRVEMRDDFVTTGSRQGRGCVSHAQTCLVTACEVS